MAEVWVLRRSDGHLLPPIDDDSTDVFMAWPSEEDCKKGLAHHKMWIDEGTEYLPHLLCSYPDVGT